MSANSSSSISPIQGIGPPRPYSKIPVIILLLIAGLITGTFAHRVITHQSATLDIEALITKGTTFRIYYNNKWTEPESAPIRPNEWTHYRFSVPARITALRFDPSDQANALAYIRSILVSSDSNQKSQTINIFQLKEWIGAHVLANAAPDGTSMLLATDAPGGYLMDAEDIDLGNRFRMLEHFRLDAGTLLWCLIATGAVLMLFGIERNKAATPLFATALVICSFFVFRTTAIQLLRVKGSLPSVTHTVGAAAYSGFSKSAELRSLNIAICAAAICTLLGGVGWRWRRREPLFIRFPDSEGRAISLPIFGVIFAICTLFAFPPAHSYLAAATTAIHPTDFDSQNIFIWEFLFHQGKLPWRDFWFPYGETVSRLAPLYPDILYEFLHETFLIGILVWCALKIFGNRLSVVISCCVLYFLLVSARVFWPGASSRYFMSVSIVALMAVAVREARLRYFVVLGVWCGYVVAQEFSHLIYALPACAVLFIAGELGATSRRQRLHLAVQAATGAAAVLGTVCCYLLILYWNSQLAGWWAFVKSLNDQADYGAWPARIQDWVAPNGSLDSAFVVLTVLLIATGILHLSFRPRSSDVYVSLPLSFGVLSWMLLQKQIIRPGIEAQILGAAFFGVVILLFQRGLASFSLRRMAWLSFSMGILFSLFILDDRVWSAAVVPQIRQIEVLPQNIAALFKSDKWKQENRMFFIASSFDFGGVTGVQVRDRLQSLAPTTRGEAIYVLGSDPLLYMLLQKPVPFYTNIYNDSPIDAQKTTLLWLENNTPRYILWNVDAKEFDGVPNVIRIPIVFTYIIEHYKLAAKEGQYHILKRMDQSGAPDLEYWRNTIGVSTDLGYIPAASSLTEGEKGDQLRPVLIAETPSPSDGRRICASLRIGESAYPVCFFERQGRSHYAIRLDRIPLLEAQMAFGGKVQLGAPTPDIRLEIRQLPIPATDLY